MDVTEKSILTRKKMIEKASLSFYKNGYDKTTFAHVAKNVGVTQPALYAYFASKLDLLIECAIAGALTGREYADRQMKERDPAPVKLKAWIRGNIEWAFEKPQDCFSVASLFYFAGTDPKAHETYQSIMQTGTQRVETYLIQGQREGVWKIKKTALMARHIQSLMVGEIFKVLYPNEKVDPQKVYRDIWKAVKSQLD